MFLLKLDAAQVVSTRELAGRTLRYGGCTGAGDLALSFSADGTTATLGTFAAPTPGLPALGARPYSASDVQSLTSATGLRSGTTLERWLVYRVTAPDGTPSYMLITVGRFDVDGRTGSMPMWLFLPV